MFYSPFRILIKKTVVELKRTNFLFLAQTEKNGEPLPIGHKTELIGLKRQQLVEEKWPDVCA